MSAAGADFGEDKPNALSGGGENAQNDPLSCDACVASWSRS